MDHITLIGHIWTTLHTLATHGLQHACRPPMDLFPEDPLSMSLLETNISNPILSLKLPGILRKRIRVSSNIQYQVSTSSRGVYKLPRQLLTT